MSSHFNITSAVLALALFGSLNAAQAGTYALRQLDVPAPSDDISTFIYNTGNILSINNVGAILTSSGVLEPNGTFTPISGGALAFNDTGQVVGYGFLFSGGVYTSLVLPDIPVDIPDPVLPVRVFLTPYTFSATGINNAGVIVGSALTSNAVGAYAGTFLYVYDRGTFQEIGTTRGEISLDINNVGQIFTNRPGGGGIGFYHDGVSTPINVPGLHSAPNVVGINDEGWIVGYYFDEQSIRHGFLYANGVTTTIDYPGSLSTEVLGINDAGKIVGEFIDSVDGPVHRFVGTPVPEPGSLVLFGGLSMVLVRLRIRRKHRQPSCLVA